MSEQSGAVAATTVTPVRRGGARWGVALVLIALLVGALGAAGTLVSTPTPPDAITYVPAGSAAVLEVRPDLPGDQRNALGEILQRVPGFANLATLNDRVNAALDAVVGRATGGQHTYTGDLRPYAAGAALLALPPAAYGVAGARPEMDRGLAILTTEGNPGCVPLEGGRSVTIERYRDTDIRTSEVTRGPLPSAPAASVGPGTPGAPGSVTLACAVAGTFVLVGDPESVRAGLDARALGRNVAGDASYTAAFRALPEAHAAWAYVNSHEAAALVGTLPLPSGFTSDAIGSTLPEWTAIQLRFTAGAVIVETAQPDHRAAMLAALPAASGRPAPTIGPAAVSDLAPGLPSTTVALVEAHQVGSLLAALSALERPLTAGPSASGGLESQVPGLGSMTGALAGGGVLALAAGLDQAGVIVIRDGAALSAGLVARIANPAVISAGIDQLRLMGGGLGGVTSVDYHGTAIVTVPLDAVAALGGLMGLTGSSGLSGILPGPGASARPGPSSAPVPGAPAVPGPPAAGSLSIALHGGLLVVGLGDAVVRAIIDTAPGASLAEQSGYKSAMTVAGSPNLGSFFVDIAAVRAALPDARPLGTASPAASANPFIQVAGAAAGSITSADGLLRGRLVITIQ